MLNPVSLCRDDTAGRSVAVSSDYPLHIFSGGYEVSTTVTRPANTTQYTAGDVVGGVITFTNIGPAGKMVYLIRAILEVYIAAIPSGMTSFRLYLFSETPPSALADNAVWSMSAADRAVYAKTYIDLGSPAVTGGILQVSADDITKSVQLADGSTDLYGYLVTNSTYTPAAGSEVYVPTLHAMVV